MTDFLDPLGVGQHGALLRIPFGLGYSREAAGQQVIPVDQPAVETLPAAVGQSPSSTTGRTWGRSRRNDSVRRLMRSR